MVSRSGEPIRTSSEDTPIQQWTGIHLSSLQRTPLRQRDLTSKDRSLYSHVEWRGGMDQPVDLGEGDAFIPRDKRTKLPPMQQTAYFLVMELMGNSAIDYGTQRTGI